MDETASKLPDKVQNGLPPANHRNDTENDKGNEVIKVHRKPKNPGNPNPKPFGRHNHYHGADQSREALHDRMEATHQRNEEERARIARGTEAPPPGAGPNWAKNRAATLAKAAKRTNNRHKKYEKKMRKEAEAAAVNGEGKDDADHEQGGVVDGGVDKDVVETEDSRLRPVEETSEMLSDYRQI